MPLPYDLFRICINISRWYGWEETHPHQATWEASSSSSAEVSGHFHINVWFWSSVANFEVPMGLSVPLLSTLHTLSLLALLTVGLLLQIFCLEVKHLCQPLFPHSGPKQFSPALWQLSGSGWFCSLQELKGGCKNQTLLQTLSSSHLPSASSANLLLISR